jgi:hypothetical protein
MLKTMTALPTHDANDTGCCGGNSGCCGGETAGCC